MRTWQRSAAVCAALTVVVVTGCGGPVARIASSPRQSALTAHPADSNQNQQISISEVTAYGAAWKSGATWATEPNPIPIGYVTNAGAIWKSGEAYHADATATPPFVAGAAPGSPLFQSEPSGFDLAPVGVETIELAQALPTRVAQGELLVVLVEARTVAQEQAVAAVIAAAGASQVGQDPIINTIRVRCADTAAAAALEAELLPLPAVLDVAYNSLLSSDVAAIDESPSQQYQTGGWWISDTRVRTAWGLMRDSDQSPVTVGVVDTGLDVASEPIHFSGKSIQRVGSYHNEDDDRGHGTFVASLAVAPGDDASAAAGVAWDAPLVVGRVKPDLGDDGYTASQLATQIGQCLAAGARAVNVSFGDETELADQELRHGLLGVVFAAAHRDALIVFSAGNAYDDGPEAGRPIQNSYLGERSAAFDLDSWSRIMQVFGEHTIIVGALNSSGQAASFSDRGELVQLWAPGEGVASARDNDLRGYTSVNSRVAAGNGTSFSAPIVTGACALLWQLNPDLTAAQVKRLLLDNVRVRNGLPTLNIGAAAEAAYRGDVLIQAE